MVYASVVSNYWTESNDQSKPNEPVDEIDRAIAGYRELVVTLSTSRGPEFADPGVTMAQMKVLMLLSVGEARMSDLSHQLGVSPSTVSSVVERLVEAGLAQRREDERDRRITLVSLTSSGVDTLDTFQELGIRHLRELLGQLDEAELNTVNQAVEHLVAAARRLSAEDHK
jgi:DNA-binding MarR family transcriptional regulator